MAEHGQSRWDGAECVFVCVQPRIFALFQRISCVRSVLSMNPVCEHFLDMCLLLLPCVAWMTHCYLMTKSLTLQQWQADNHLLMSWSGVRLGNKHISALWSWATGFSKLFPSSGGTHQYELPALTDSSEFDLLGSNQYNLQRLRIQ